MIAVIYFYFLSLADVKFFFYTIFTLEGDRTSGLLSIAGVNRPCCRGDDRRFSQDFGKLRANIERTKVLTTNQFDRSDFSPSASLKV
ncbi:MAG: hypothetical protein EAZ60_13415 [Oscillatoriales cyanobacterium]|nr:MAG: hypothetical protein EAZ79_24085 [Oscillatoriales cyanobacterium]TAF55374.1 MAG: hypothetical protein EAZ60_13415 [Oscillatoriales cyanobacterium]